MAEYNPHGHGADCTTPFALPVCRSANTRQKLAGQSGRSHKHHRGSIKVRLDDHWQPRFSIFRPHIPWRTSSACGLSQSKRSVPSLKSHLVAFVLRHTRKKAFASASEMNRWIAAARRTEDHRPPAAIARRLSVSSHQVDGFPVYEVSPRSGTKTPMRVLYMHGGAYVFEISRYHWGLIAEMAERLGAQITVPIYPLAPPHDLHSMFGMVSNV